MLLSRNHGQEGTIKGLAGILAAVMVVLGAAPAGQATANKHCTSTAVYMLRACAREKFEAYWIGRAVCQNMSDPDDRRECAGEAWQEFRDGLIECNDQFSARLDLCDELGEAAYDPEIDPDDFVGVIDNPYFPLTPGTTRVYEGETEDGMERIEVEVTHDTKEILGVTCVVVNDRVTLDGELIEDTLDWYAQDVEGNVWYFGELARDYEDGELVSLEGSFEAGRDGAKAGILMPARPQVGAFHRQEFFLGEAEDAAGVLALDQMVDVPFGVFMDCLQTVDFTPLEPDVLEHKFYAMGTGVVLEINLETGERIELVDIIVE